MNWRDTRAVRNVHVDAKANSVVSEAVVINEAHLILLLLSRSLCILILLRPCTEPLH